MKKKNKMLAFKLNEISAVDRPAQGEATMSIMKRDSHSEEKVIKDIMTNGGHGEIAKDEGDTMSDAENKVADLEKRLEESQALLAKQTLVSEMSDVEKVFMSGLESGAAEGFMKMSSEGRASEINKSQSSDPVIYKSADGTEYRKSDSTAADLAKRVDASEAKVEELAKAADKANFEKRAGVELSHVTGSIEDRAALIKAVDGITGIAEILKAANDAAKEASAEKGSSEGEADNDGKEDHYGKFKAEVSKVAKAQSISSDDAEVIVKQDNPELYAAAVKAG